MKTHTWWFGIILNVFAVGAMAQTPAQTVAGKPSNVSLTIYNDNFALVREDRPITLKVGTNYVTVEGVAAQIDPTSLSFKSLTSPQDVVIREQNYRYDVMNPSVILDKSIGQPVIIRQVMETGKVREVKGTLLSSNGGIVIRTDDGHVLLNPTGEIEVMRLPTGLMSKPSLLWKIVSSRAGENNCEISYITQGLSWHADYVAVINKNDDRSDLTGWVTLDNQSGTSYHNAELQLMAGNVRRVQNYRVYPMTARVMGGFNGERAPAPQFQQQSFFEYHLYTLQNRTDILNKETKQLTLMQASDVPVVKKYVYDGRKQWWYSAYYEGATPTPGQGYDTSSYHKVNVVLKLKNTKANHLGIPLPKGKIRLYKADNQGHLQFIGEDMIDHTPKDETLSLYVGDAFDIVGDYKRTNYHQLAPGLTEETFEITVKNHKDTPVEVSVVDHEWGTWEILKSSDKYVKKDAHTIEFPVEVPANGQTVVTYTVRTRW